MLKAWDSSQKTQSIVPLTPDQALSLMVETKESKHSYLITAMTKILTINNQVRQQVEAEHAIALK
jgi:hypothetical protein